MKKIIAFFPSIRPDTKAYLLIAIGLILLYWPISFMVYNFKWDMADQYFPWRHHVSLSLRNFELPLWNAYQYCGYPIHADPQSGAFYPVVWILSLFGSYSVVTLHIEFLLTAFIAGCGFYKLCRFFSVSSPTAILAALMYAGSGIFIGNTQHITWLISAAYLPGIFYCFFALSTSFKYKHLLAFGLLLYFHLSGGYPGFDIILFYLLIVFFIHFFFVHLNSSKLGKFLWANTLAIAVTVICSLAFIYSAFSLAPYTARGNGVSLEAAMQNAFTLPSFLSFVLPFATCRHGDIIGTDISMSNAYFGIFFLLALILYFFKAQKTRLEKIVLVLSILCLLVSVGETFPFRKWLFLYFPMMDYFRFPSAFRIFVVLFLLLLAAIQLDRYKNNLQAFKFITGTSILLLTATLFISIKKNYSGTGIADFFSNRSFFDLHSTIYDHIFLQAALQLVLLLLFLASLFLVKKHIGTLLYCFLLVDLYCSVHLNLSYTSLDFNSSPIVLHKNLKTLPRAAYIPQTKVIENNDSDQRIKPLWKNLHNFFREVAYDGYNPFSLTQYDTLTTNPHFTTILNNYPVYLAKKTMLASSPADSLQKTTKIVLLDSLSLKKYSSLQNHKKDTCRIIAFTGNKITVEASTTGPSMMVILQNILPGWHCNINGKPQAIEQVNVCLMGIPLAAGKSVVVVEYKPSGIGVLTAISLGAVFLFTTILFFCIRKNR